MSLRREIVMPSLCVAWVVTTWLTVVIREGNEPFLGGPWWIRLITGPICVAWVAFYIWRGRREA